MMHRRDWDDLPAGLRAAADQACSGVDGRTPVAAGINNAFACILDTGQGRLFVKGLPTEDQRVWMYRNELRAAEAITGLGPSLRWHLERDGWVLLAWDYQPGHHADLAPGSPDLEPIADVLRQQAERGPASGWESEPGADRWSRMRPWKRLAEAPPHDLDPWIADHLPDFAAQEDEALAAISGDHLAHTDLHEANILVSADGRAHLIDWAWARTTAAWVDAEMITLRLIAAGHTCEEADLWRTEHLPKPPPQRERWLFAVEMLGAWDYLSRLKPERSMLSEMAGRAAQWARHLDQSVMGGAEGKKLGALP